MPNVLADAVSGTIFDAADFQPIIEAITSQITPGVIVGLIAMCIGASIGLWFTWFGANRLTKAITDGLHGKFNATGKRR